MAYGDFRTIRPPDLPLDLPQSALALLKPVPMHPWGTSEPHKSGGRLLYDPGTNELRLLSFTDNRTDCPECGPRLRTALKRRVSALFPDYSAVRFAVTEYGRWGTVRKQLSRNGAFFLAIPLHSARAVFATVPVTQRRLVVSTRIPDASTWEQLLRLVAECWVKDSSRHLSSSRKQQSDPPADLAQPEPEKEIPAMVSLGTLQRPDSFRRALDQLGVHHRAPWETSAVHAALCDRRLQALLREHGFRWSGELPPGFHTEEEPWPFREEAHG